MSTDDLLQGYAAIAEALTEAFELPPGSAISKSAAYRYSTRAVRRLPTDGPMGRVWIRRGALVAWVESERQHRGPTDEDRQLGLFAAPPEPGA